MDLKHNIKVGVLMGGWSHEREISILSGQAILNALEEKGWHVVGIDVSREICERIKAEGIDCAFLAMHGPFGEDGTLQGLLEVMGIPYTGSGVLASSVSMNKLMSKRVFKASGIPTPPYIVIEKVSDIICQNPFGFPVVVKPCSQGSTIGIHIVDKEEGLADAISDAFDYDDTILLEEYVPGREFTVGIFDREPLPLLEIIPKSGFYNYHSKYTPGETEYLCPAPLETKRSERIQELALLAFKVLGCRDFSRVDFRLGINDSIYCLEVNTLPGMTNTSLLPKAAKQKGITFSDLTEKILLMALSRKV